MEKEKGQIQKPITILSRNMPGDCVCVDYFQRQNGSYGFEEYRRDPEDNRGWFVIGFHAGNVFKSFADA